MKDYEERKARERQGTRSDIQTSAPIGADVEFGRVSEKLAAVAGVGRRTVERAIKVREEGTPELNAAVAAGEIALKKALRSAWRSSQTHRGRDRDHRAMRQ